MLHAGLLHSERLRCDSKQSRHSYNFERHRLILSYIKTQSPHAFWDQQAEVASLLSDCSKFARNLLKDNQQEHGLERPKGGSDAATLPKQVQ